MTLIIGLMGPAGAGKSSIAQYLVEKHGATRYSFAGPLKDMVGRALGFTHEQLWGTQMQKESPDERYGGKSARWFLQRIGTEGCRKTFGETFWTDQLIAKIDRERPAIAVIDDARFVNEAKAIRAYRAANQLRPQGLVWRLESPDRETEADATHASEQEWTDAPYDCIIRPAARGLGLLFQLVDAAFKLTGYAPAKPEKQDEPKSTTLTATPVRFGNIAVHAAAMAAIPKEAKAFSEEVDKLDREIEDGFAQANPNWPKGVDL